MVTNLSGTKKSAVAYKPILSKEDVYQTSANTNYYRDQTTGELYLASGTNVRSIIPEQFKTAVFAYGTNSANGGLQTVYTVPAGKVLLLLGLTLQVSFNAGTFANGTTLKLNGSTVIEAYGAVNGGGYAISQNLSSIIVLDENKLIEVNATSANMRGTCSFFGYVVDKSEYLGHI